MRLPRPSCASFPVKYTCSALYDFLILLLHTGLCRSFDKQQVVQCLVLCCCESVTVKCFQHTQHRITISRRDRSPRPVPQSRLSPTERIMCGITTARPAQCEQHNRNDRYRRKTTATSTSASLI